MYRHVASYGTTDIFVKLEEVTPIGARFRSILCFASQLSSGKGE